MNPDAKFPRRQRVKGAVLSFLFHYQHENVPMKMKSFDDSLMKTCQILKDVTPDHTHCLRALVKSDPLVKWLKESMKKGKQNLTLTYLSHPQERDS